MNLVNLLFMNLKMSTKKCTNCGEDKPTSDYYVRSNGKLQNQCKQCIQKKAREKRNKNKRLASIKKTCTECDRELNLKNYIEISDSEFHTKCNRCCSGKEFLCITCKVVKTADNFWMRNDTNKPRGECKKCTINRKQKWRKDNEEHYKNRVKKYKSRPEVKQRSKEYHHNYYMKPENKQRKRNREKLRYNTDINYKMKKLMRSRICDLMAKGGYSKADTSMKLLGCEFPFFKTWIEYQFDAYMTWDNHGTYWHLDHIKPCALFNLALAIEQKKCFHWTNLQPLSGPENMEKKDKYDDSIKFKAELMLQSFRFHIRS